MTPILFFLGVAVVMLVIGWLAGRKQSDEGFNVYDRNLPGWLYAISYAATSMGAGFIVVGTAYVYLYGLGFGWIFLGYALGIAVFGFYTSWLKKLTQKLKFYTFGDYVQWRFGKATAIIFSVLSVLMIAGDLAIQLVSGGKLLEELGVAPFLSSVILTVVVIGLYLFASGFRAVVWTDVVLLVAMVLLILVLGFATLPIVAHASKDSLIKSPTWVFAVTFLLYGIFAPFSSVTNYQRVFSGRNERTVRHGTWASFLWLIVPLLILLLLGTAARIVAPNVDPDTAYIQLIKHFGSFVLYGGAVLLWAALMSTADTMAFVGSQVTFHNILQRPMNKRNARYGIILMLGFGLLISLLIPSVIKVSILFLGGSMGLAIPFFVHWFVKVSARAMLSSVLVSTLSMLIYAFFVAFDPIIVAVGMGVSTVVLFLVHFVEKLYQRN